MMSSTFGAPLGGTTVGGQYGLESTALSLITPPNGTAGGGSCFPSMVMVELGEPGVPVVCICALAQGATAMTAAASIPPRRICFIDFIGVNSVCCCSSIHLRKRNLQCLRRFPYRTLGLCTVEPRSRPAFAQLRRGRHGCLYNCGGTRVACETGYKRGDKTPTRFVRLFFCHLSSFFPPTAVADILGEGDKAVVGLVA